MSPLGDIYDRLSEHVPTHKQAKLRPSGFAFWPRRMQMNWLKTQEKTARKRVVNNAQI